MSDMNVSLIIRLLDQFSQPAKRLRDNFRSIANDMRGGFADAIRQGFSVDNVNAAISQAETAMGKAKGRLIGALGMAAAVAAPVVNLGRFETDLVSFGNTAGIFGDDLQGVGDQLRVLGPQVNKSASEMLSALDYMVGKGLSPEEGIAALQAVGMTATATGADINDMAASGYAVLDNLNVPADQLQQAFDAMAQAGKAGGFELKSMAQVFPSLTAQARSLGMEGVPAVAELGAALQVALKGAGSEDAAATNMENFLTKLTSPEAVKAFQDVGVNLEDEFQKASDNGVSVLEHMLTLIGSMTAGDQFALGELFGDAQVKSFLLPLIADLDEFKSIRDAALSADGVNQGDFGRMMDTFAEKVKAIMIQLDNLSSSGSVLLDIAKDLAGQIGAGLAAANAFAEANPELTRTLVLVAAGMMTLSIASRLAAFGLAGTRLGMLGLVNLFLKFDETGKNVATGWRLLAGAGGLVSGAFNIIVAAGGAVLTALGAISAPVWGIIAVLVAAGFALWKYWDRISSFVSGMAEGLGNLLAPAIDGIKGAIDGLLNKLGELLGIDASQMDAFKAAVADGFAAAFNFGPMIDGAKQLLSGFWTWLGGFFTQETLSDADKGAMHEAGSKLIEELWNGIQARFAEVIDWFHKLPDLITGAIGQIDLTGIIKMPDVGGWWAGITGGEPPPEAPGGGPAAPGADALSPSAPALQGQLNTTIAAEVIDKRPPQVNVAVTQNISGVGDPGAVGAAARQGLAEAFGQASSGALHDGME